MTLLDLPYQAEGAAFLASRKAALLADDPRLGKTIQTIRAADQVRALQGLILCPAGVVENWKRAIKQYRTGDWSAYVTSYDLASGSDYKRLLNERWCFCAVDEAHYLKNLTTKRTRAVYGKNAEMGDDAIATRADQVWLLTGTPMPNNPSELYPHLRALYVDAIRSDRTGLPLTFFQFVHAYCLLRSNGFGDQIVGSKNEAKLHEKLKGFMLRRRKSEVWGQLPPTRFAELYVEGDVADLPGDEIALVRKALEDHGVAGLKRLAANGSVSTLRRLVGMAKVGGVRKWLANWLESTPRSEKIVVFAHHHDVIEALYDSAPAAFVRVNRDTRPKERQKLLDRFCEDPSVRGLICRMTGEGIGISLARANEMIVVEPSYVPAVNDQVYERIFDLGKKDPNIVRIAMIAGSIDEAIQRACVRKMASIGAVVDGQSL